MLGCWNYSTLYIYIFTYLWTTCVTLFDQLCLDWLSDVWWLSALSRAAFRARCSCFFILQCILFLCITSSGSSSLFAVIFNWLWLLLNLVNEDPLVCIRGSDSFTWLIGMEVTVPGLVAEVGTFPWTCCCHLFTWDTSENLGLPFCPSNKSCLASFDRCWLDDAVGLNTGRVGREVTLGKITGLFRAVWFIFWATGGWMTWEVPHFLCIWWKRKENSKKRQDYFDTQFIYTYREYLHNAQSAQLK